MRTTPLSDWSEQAAAFEAQIRDAAETVLGFKFDEAIYTQASHPGIGLRRTVDHADTAFAASFLEAMAESGEAWSVPPVVVTFSAGSQKEAS